MKCEKCNNHEANFHYRQTINGETAQHHFCSECAQSEGFGDTLSYSAMDFNFDRMISQMMGYNPFGMRAGLLGDYRPMIFTPMLMTAQLPQVEVSVEKEASEDKIPAGCHNEFNSKREIAALRHQLKAAVKSEEYEKAAELRDKIKEMEGNL